MTAEVNPDRSKKRRRYCDCGNRAEVMHNSDFICIRCRDLDKYVRHHTGSARAKSSQLSTLTPQPLC